MRVAISIGCLNGVGIEIAIREHIRAKKVCHPIYIIDRDMLDQALKLLNLQEPDDFQTVGIGDFFQISPSKVTAKSGRYSYNSFLKAVELAEKKEVDAITTLPINKESWSRAGVKFKGHTEFLSDYFKKEAIMMIGCEKLFSAFYTHHIPIKDIPKMVKKEPLREFLINFYNQIKESNIAVLALNPHAGDGGVLGDEEIEIQEAIKEANSILKERIFIGPIVPDTAFTPYTRERFRYYISIYHDQGLIAIKSLYFDESINVTLNLPIIRTSVDHGTAYDIAYKDKKPSTKSYINALKEAVRVAQKRERYLI